MGFRDQSATGADSRCAPGPLRTGRPACRAPLRSRRRGNFGKRARCDGLGAEPNRAGQDRRCECRDDYDRWCIRRSGACWLRFLGARQCASDDASATHKQPGICRLNVATLLIYIGLSIMFFLVPFDLVDRRGLSPVDAGLISSVHTRRRSFVAAIRGRGDKFGARAMLIVGPLGAALALLLLAFGKPLRWSSVNRADGTAGDLVCSAHCATHRVSMPRSRTPMRVWRPASMW